MSNPAYRVLVVDDDPGMLAFLAHLVAAEGMTAETVSDAAEALERATHAPPDLVLCDVMLPGMDGFAVCERLKNDPATAMIPIVLVTALEDRASRVRGIRAGADDFLSKPVSREELVARVKTLRRLHEMRRELEARRLAAEVQRKEALRKAFSRYLSPRIAERIVADLEEVTPFETGPRRVSVVALFADLRGFTRLTESTQVDDVVGLLNEYFSVLTDAAYRQEGTIFSMAGDSLLIGFNVPFPQASAEALAWAATQDMVANVRPVIKRWIARGGTPTGIGFGIASGEAILGNIGSPHYMSHTIIGDAVNVASRLVAMAQPDELLASGAIYERIRGLVPRERVSARGRVALRGRGEPVEVYSVRL